VGERVGERVRERERERERERARVRARARERQRVREREREKREMLIFVASKSTLQGIVYNGPEACILLQYICTTLD
jgi:hypothetical protein